MVINNKFFIKSLTTLTASSAILAFASIPAFSNTNGNMGLELHYFDSAFGCGPGQIDIDVRVYKNNILVQTMSVGDRYLLTDIDDVEDLSFEYHSDDPEFYADYCRDADGVNHQILGSQDSIPSLPGAHSQLSLQSLVSGLNDYEELYLVELATQDTSSDVYDLQDVILVVDNNPELPNNAPVAQNDAASTTIFNSITIDVLSNDVDADGDLKTISAIVPDPNSNNGSDLGTITISNDNSELLYNAGGTPGNYSFVYTVEDEHGDSDLGTLLITVGAFPD